MRWLLKALAQTVVAGLPGSHELGFAFQRRVTRTLPRSDAELRRKVGRAMDHFAALLRHRGSAAGVRAYEVGAGWDLVVALAYFALGIDEQLVVDIRPNARLELVGDAARRLGRMDAELAAEAGRPLRDLGCERLRDTGDLWRRFRIDYRAPLDARRTGLPSAWAGFASSTNTLEHVPEHDLLPLLAETRRLLAPDGVFSCRIDLRDHYSYFDRSISAYNFLTISDARWRLVNPSLHHQNRLRWPDYRRLFEEAGFAILDERRAGPTERDVELLRDLSLAPRFRRYSLEDLGVTAGTIVARPATRALPRRAGDRGESEAVPAGRGARPSLPRG